MTPNFVLYFSRSPKGVWPSPYSSFLDPILKPRVKSTGISVLIRFVSYIPVIPGDTCPRHLMSSQNEFPVDTSLGGKVVGYGSVARVLNRYWSSRRRGKGFRVCPVYRFIVGDWWELLVSLFMYQTKSKKVTCRLILHFCVLWQLFVYIVFKIFIVL